MERLTYTDKDGGVCCPWERNSVNGSYDIWDEEGLIKQLNRLAAYEDTGLEPEQVLELKSFTQGGIHKVDDGWKHVQELLRAEQDGRLVVLPCKVGDTVCCLHNGFITECRVHRIQMNRTGLFICLKSKVSHGAFRVDICLGKTVFLTREEAEAALAGKGGEGSDGFRTESH